MGCRVVLFRGRRLKKRLVVRGLAGHTRPFVLLLVLLSFFKKGIFFLISRYGVVHGTLLPNTCVVELGIEASEPAHIHTHVHTQNIRTHTFRLLLTVLVRFCAVASFHLLVLF